MMKRSHAAAAAAVAVAVAVVTAGAGCPDPVLPPGAVVRCADDTDCPGELLCATATSECSPRDTVPPGPISDLRVDVDVQPPTETTVNLLWTAPGDDGGEPRTKARRYTLRLTRAGDTEPVILTLDQAPQEAGSRESFLVEALAPATVYAFVVVAFDEFDNKLDSNEIEGATAGNIACDPALTGECPGGQVCSPVTSFCVPEETAQPGPVSDLRADQGARTATSLKLRWTAPGDDGTAPGTQAARQALLVRDGDDSADTRVELPAPLASGAAESAELFDLVEGTVYTVTLEVTDDAGNTSRSNTVLAATAGDVLCDADDGCETGQLCSTVTVPRICTDDEAIPPGPVDDLVVDPFGQTATSVRVRFTAPGDDGASANSSAARYVVQFERVGGDPGAPDGEREGPLPGLVNSPEVFDVEGLVAGTLYRIEVRAVDDAGNESVSNPVLAATAGAVACVGDAECQPATERCALEGPAVCVLREAVAPGTVDDLAVVDAADTSLTLEWSAPADDGFLAGSGVVQRYEIVFSEVSGDGDGPDGTIAGPAAPLPANEREELVLGGLEPGEVYSVRVRALDDNGNASLSAPVQGATAGGAGGISCVDDAGCADGDRCSQLIGGFCVEDEAVPPGSPLLAAGAVDTTSIELTWTAPGDDGFSGAGAGFGAVHHYVLDVTPNDGTTVSTDLSTATPPLAPQVAGAPESYVVSGLAPAKVHTFILTAVDDLGNRGESAPLAVATEGRVPCIDAGDCLPGDICSAILLGETGAAPPFTGGCTDADAIVPGPIADLRNVLAATRPDRLTVRFSAPGDDGYTAGTRAVSYEVRLRADVDGDGDFTPGAPGSPDTEETRAVANAPLVAFAPQDIEVTGLVQGLTYEISVDAVDDAGNRSTSLPVVAETGGAVCTAVDGAGDNVASGALIASTDEHLARLSGCEVIDGSLTLDMRGCGVRALELLDDLERISGTLRLQTNPLCAGGDVLDAMDRLEHVGTLFIADEVQLEEVHLRGLRTMERFGLFPEANRLSVLDLPLLESVDTELDLQAPATLTALALPALRTVGGILTLGGPVTSVTLPQLQSVAALQLGGGRPALPALTALALPALTTASFGLFLDDGEAFFGDPAFSHAPLLTALDLPALADAGVVGIGGLPALDRLDLSALGAVDALSLRRLPLLADLRLGALATAGSIVVDGRGGGAADGAEGIDFVDLSPPEPSVAALSLPALTSVGTLVVAGISNLTSLSAPLLQTGERLKLLRLPALASVDLPALTTLVPPAQQLGIDLVALGVLDVGSAAPGGAPLGVLRLPALQSAGGIFIGLFPTADPQEQQALRTRVTRVELPALTTTTGPLLLAQATALEALQVPALQAVGDGRAELQITLAQSGATLIVQGVVLLDVTGLTSLALPQLVQTATFDPVCTGPQEAGVTLAALPDLQSASLPALAYSPSFAIAGAPLLSAIAGPPQAIGRLFVAGTADNGAVRSSLEPRGCSCGDGACSVEAGEDLDYCSADCAAAVCGDLICSGPEQLALTCPGDCP